MRYAQWNNLLFEYFFLEGQEHEIFLGIDKEALIDYVIDKGAFNEEIERFLTANPNRKIKSEDYIWNNFLHLFRRKDAIGKNVLFDVFRQHLAESKTVDRIPTIFPCLALFLMPLANHPEMDPRNFYDRLTKFLRENGIINITESIDTPDMKQIENPSLSEMWENLETWARKEGFEYKVKANASSRFKYVSPFMAESLLTATQRDKFKLIFYEAGLTPDLDMSEDRIVSLLNNYHKLIGFTDDAYWKKLFEKYRSILINEFARKYIKWNGDTVIRIHENNRRLNRDFGINKKLYLCMSVFRGNYCFLLRTRFPDAEPGSEFKYIATGHPSYEFSIGNEGYADTDYIPENLTTIIDQGRGLVLREATNPRNRIAFQNEEFFLLEKYFNTYTSSCKLKIGGKFFILVRNDALPSYQGWLDENSAQKVTGNNPLASTYTLFFIPEARTSFTTHNALNCETRKSAKLTDTFIVRQENGITTIYKSLPAFFDIQGVDVSHDSVRAVVFDGLRNTSKDLSYDEDHRLWKLPVISNTLLLHGSFQLYCNDQLISSTVYRFDDFNPLPDDGYQEISYDEWGNYSKEATAFSGLSVKGATGLADMLKSNMRQFGHVPEIKKNPYQSSDYLLYWLSSRARTNRSDLKDAIQVQVQNAIASEKAVEKWSIRNLIDNYSRLGYINYAYNEGQHLIAVNRPTLVLLPAKVNKTSFGRTKTVSCAEKYFKVLLTGARTPAFIDKLLKRAEAFSYNGSRLMVQIDEKKDPLYPQRILLWAEDIWTIRAFAEKYGIHFQYAIYANIMLENLGSVSDYEKHVEETYRDFRETYEEITDFSVIDYSALAELMQKDQFIHLDRIYRTEYDRSGSVVTYFPGKYYEKSILWKDGNQYPVDKYWGHFIGMRLAGVSAVKIDTEDSTFKMPLSIKLPLLYARALTMITGEIPEYSQGRRVYQLCDNPFAEAMSPDAILKKLS